jgi:hypothetical protein
MTTITIEKDIKLASTTFSSIDDFLSILLKIQRTSVEEEIFSEKEKKILENRNISIKNIENDIIASFK